MGSLEVLQVPSFSGFPFTGEVQGNPRKHAHPGNGTPVPYGSATTDDVTELAPKALLHSPQ